MKKVLILAYYFPPLGMGGTQRAAKFVKYLPDFGWEPIVVTVKEIAYYAQDPSLLEDVKGARIIRCGSLDPQRLMRILVPTRANSSQEARTTRSAFWHTVNRTLAWLLIPDSKILWIPFAIVRALLVIRNERIDCLFTTSPPHSVQLAGILLKRLTHIPLVVDFRDGWSHGNFQREPTRLHRWLNCLLEQRVLRKADRVVSVSRKLTEDFRAQAREHDDKCTTITNGYDPTDFCQEHPEVKSGHKFHVLYCGALSDIAPSESFLAALVELFRERPELRSEVEVEFVGQGVAASLWRKVPKGELNGIVKFAGYLQHGQALNRMKKANLLLYPVAEWASPDFVPGKTFEYLASGVPVLAIGAVVEGVRILQAHTVVSHVGYDDKEGMKSILLRHFENRHQRRSGQSTLNRQVEFERRNLTRALADVFEQVA